MGQISKDKFKKTQNIIGSTMQNHKPRKMGNAVINQKNTILKNKTQKTN